MALVAKISGLGQYCTRHSNGGAGSVMSSSFDNPGDFRGSVLAQESPVNNAGQLAGTIINNVYQGIAGRTVSEPDLLAAEELLSRLPEAAALPLPPYLRGHGCGCRAIRCLSGGTMTCWRLPAS